MKIGFTGTQLGMSREQKKSFELFISYMPMTEFHHGDCIGADAQAHDMVRHMWPELPIIIHPPSNRRARANKGLNDPFTTILPEEDYRARNQSIVDQTEGLVATPKRSFEEQRSGTWMTVRMARRSHHTVRIIDPDGQIHPDKENT